MQQRQDRCLGSDTLGNCVRDGDHCGQRWEVDEKCSGFTMCTGKHSEELESRNIKVMVSAVVGPGQAEADEADRLARASADCEVDRGSRKRRSVRSCHVNDRPRSLARVI